MFCAAIRIVGDNFGHSICEDVVKILLAPQFHVPRNRYRSITCASTCEFRLLVLRMLVLETALAVLP